MVLNFSKSHEFLATNPGPFIELLGVTLREFVIKQSLNELQYQLGEDGGHNCVITAILLLGTMLDNVDLLPLTARLLITKLCKIQADSFPFLQLFALDTMFCNYLENTLLTANAVAMRDLCNVLRCTYPQSIYPLWFLRINSSKI
jgi:hypothetical protein